MLSKLRLHNIKLPNVVWVFTPKTRKGLSKKLLHHWHGPYRIMKQLSPVNFKLRNSANRLVATPVHACESYEIVL